jgi:hypothetical protein
MYMMVGLPCEKLNKSWQRASSGPDNLPHNTDNIEKCVIGCRILDFIMEMTVSNIAFWIISFCRLLISSLYYHGITGENVLFSTPYY